MRKKIVFVGGGSIGHVAPAIAVWRALKEKDPAAEAHFVCSTRAEDAAFLKENGLPLTELDAPRLSFSFLWKFFQAVRASRNILDAEQPNLIFSKGGYVSLPLCYAAHQKGIPIILHESDAVGGYANRLVGRWASTVCLGFPQTTEDTPHTKNVVTGNPVRPEVMRGSREEGLKVTGFTGDRPILLVLGGSQGAQALNDAVIKHIDALAQLCDIAHITGRGKISGLKHPGYWSREFVTTELPHLYAIAQLALSRAGAGAITELAACEIATILVPLRGVGHDHQEQNAKIIERIGGCTRLEQDRLDAMLLPTVRELLTNSDGRRKMAEKIRGFHRPGAAGQIAEIIAGTLAHTAGDH